MFNPVRPNSLILILGTLVKDRPVTKRVIAKLTLFNTDILNRPCPSIFLGTAVRCKWIKTQANRKTFSDPLVNRLKNIVNGTFSNELTLTLLKAMFVPIKVKSGRTRQPINGRSPPVTSRNGSTAPLVNERTPPRIRTRADERIVVPWERCILAQLSTLRQLATL